MPAQQESWNYATARRRAAAWIIDAVILLVLWYIQIGVFAGFDLNRDGPGFFQTFTALVILYGVLFIAYGATPGKRICGLRVVDGRNERPGLARSLKRSLLPGVKWVALLYFLLRMEYDLEIRGNIGSLLVALVVFGLSFLVVYDLLPIRKSPSRQTWHDEWASTYVLAAK